MNVKDELTYMEFMSKKRAVFCVRYVCVMLFLFIFPPCSHAIDNSGAVTIDILYTKEKPYYEEFSNSLYAQLADDPRFRVKMVTTDDYSTYAQQKGYTLPGLVISVGQKPAGIFLQQGRPAPVLFTLITRAFYNEQIRTHELCDITQCSAIFIDQPVSRYLALIDSMFPPSTRIGVLVDEGNHELARKIRSISKWGKRNIQIHNIASNADLPELLPELFKETDVLLSLPDTAIYNRNTIRNILLTTLRLRIPVIGYSRSYVKAGATAGIFTEIAQISRQTRESAILLTLEQPGSMINSPPRYYSVDINYWVAESLKLKITELEEIEKRVKGDVKGDGEIK